MENSGNTLVSHLEELRKALLKCVAATGLLYPLGYWATAWVIDALVRRCFPAGMELHYFSPMEVFWVRLKLALILSLAAAYPWNMLQLWNFILPALYPRERRAFGRWILLSSALFFAGGAFCVGAILPMLMRFSAGFATPELRPMIGLANFIDLAGWLVLAFGAMFQSPLAVLIAVRFGAVSVETLAAKRPYVVTVILVLSALLTPPDVLSQLLLALPTYLLFELGLLLARRRKRD